MALVLPFSSHSQHHFRLSNYSPVRDSQPSVPAAMDAANGPRISLPPISSLIDGPGNDPNESAPERSPQSAHIRKTSLPSPTHSQSHERISHVGSPRGLPPATPPLPPPSSFDFPHHAALNASPPATSAPTSNSFAQGPSGPASETYPSRTSSYPPIPDSSSNNNNNNNQAPRTSAYPPLPEPQSWQSQHPAQAPPLESPTQEPGSRPSQSPYLDPTGHGSYPPPPTQQRPLPTFAPPSYYGQQMPPIDPQMAPQWQQQHPHYLPQHAAVPYPQSQGGYPCASCSRVFSRPSSLRIHENSHTGAKPFACQYPGCNKRFSVRSNRKRHERGCHERLNNKENGSSGHNDSDRGNSPGTKYDP